MKISYIQGLWKKYNEQYFDGRLAEVVIRLTRSKRLYGYFEPMTNSGARSIRISGTLNKSLDQLSDTLLHEMIHQYLHQLKIEEADDHGPIFLEWATKLNVRTEHDVI